MRKVHKHALTALVALFALLPSGPLPEARAETVQSCRRKGCRLNVNTYRCICPRRVRSRAIRRPRIRCPRGARLQVYKERRKHYKHLWGTKYWCAKRRGGKRIAQGPLVMVRMNGKVSMRGGYRNGKRHGIFRNYGTNGKLRLEERWEDGKRHGRYAGWFFSGQMVTRGRYQKGQRVGLWESWHRNGKLAKKGAYAQGQKTGLWLHWHSNGKKKMEEPCKNDGRHGVLKRWNIRGQLIETSIFVEDRRHGKSVTLLGGSRLVLFYQRGKVHGLYRRWHRNGKLHQESSYQHGQLHGLARVWNNRGILKRRRRYVNGQLHGLSESWYDNRRLQEKGHWAKGRKVGTWVQYATDGSELSRHTYP